MHAPKCSVWIVVSGTVYSFLVVAMPKAVRGAILTDTPMLQRLVWIGLIVGSLLGNGCGRPQRVSTPAEPIEGKLVLLEHRSGDVIKGRVQATTDSTVVLVPEPDRLIGHTDSIVVHVDDISSVRVLGTHPLQYATTGIVVSFAVLLIYFAIAWRGVSFGG